MRATRTSYLCSYFSAGAFSGVLVYLFVFLLHTFDLGESIDVPISSAVQLGDFYSYVFWSGVAGFLFFVPFLPYHVLFKGILLSLIVSAFQLFYLFPFHQEAGWLGLALSQATPVFILIVNALWGLIAGILIRACLLEG